MVKGEELKDVGVNVGVKISAREHDLLELLRLDGTLTAVRIAETYSISTRQAERLLQGSRRKASSSVFARPTKQEWNDKVQGEFETNGKNLKA